VRFAFFNAIMLLALFFGISFATETGRWSIPLDGTWDFLPRLSDFGEGGRHMFESPEADRSTWRKIEVPSCFQRVFKDLEYFEGVCWYARKFNFNADPESVYAEFVFEGINYLSRVYLNGQVLADHEGGFTQFTVPAGKALKHGENLIAVRLDSRRHLLKLPSLIGYFNYGGIYRPLRLEVLPKVHLADVQIRTKRIDPPGVIGVDLRIEGPGGDLRQSGKVRFEVLNRNGRVVSVQERDYFLTGPSESVNCDIEIKGRDLNLWSPENPYLYRLRTKLHGGGITVDETAATFGIRTFSARGREFLVNGKPYKVHGLCYHIDFPETGRTLDEKMFALDLKNLSELNVKALRCHYPFESRMLDACDSLGIMIVYEIPVFWLRSYDRYQLLLAREMAREMVLTGGNRPCIMAWSLGDECHFDPVDYQVFFTALRDEIHRQVPDALITYATDTGSEIMAHIVDIFSENIYPGWYNFLGAKPVQWRADSTLMVENLAKVKGEIQNRIRTFPVMPFWITEVGGGAALDIPRDRWELFSEDYQATLLRHQLDMIASIPEISGIFPWIYNDFYDPSRMEAPGQRGKNLKGLVTIERKRKKSFAVLREFYRKWGR